MYIVQCPLLHVSKHIALVHAAQPVTRCVHCTFADSMYAKEEELNKKQRSSSRYQISDSRRSSTAPVSGVNLTVVLTNPHAPIDDCVRKNSISLQQSSATFLAHFSLSNRNETIKYFIRLRLRACNSSTPTKYIRRWRTNFCFRKLKRQAYMRRNKHRGSGHNIQLRQKKNKNIQLETTI